MIRLEELKEIMKELNDIRDESLLEFSDDMLLDCATRIFNNPHHKKETESFIPATEKQISYLKKLGYEGSFDGLSKKEAFKLIEEKKK